MTFGRVGTAGRTLPSGGCLDRDRRRLSDVTGEGDRWPRSKAGPLYARAPEPGLNTKPPEDSRATRSEYGCPAEDWHPAAPGEDTQRPHHANLLGTPQVHLQAAVRSAAEGGRIAFCRVRMSVAAQGARGACADPDNRHSSHDPERTRHLPLYPRLPPGPLRDLHRLPAERGRNRRLGRGGCRDPSGDTGGLCATAGDSVGEHSAAPALKRITKPCPPAQETRPPEHPPRAADAASSQQPSGGGGRETRESVHSFTGKNPREAR